MKNRKPHNNSKLNGLFCQGLKCPKELTGTARKWCSTKCFYTIKKLQHGNRKED